MPEVNGVNVPFMPAGGVQELRRRQQPPVHTPGTTQGPSFKEVFDNEVTKLKFSAHAQTRLTSREIPLTPGDIGKLESAVDKASAKGAKESLIMLDDMAFIVSVPNRTVITAVSAAQLKENVFTNIDSAVIV